MMIWRMRVSSYATRKLLRAGEISRQQHQRFLLPLMMNRKYEISD